MTHISAIDTNNLKSATYNAVKIQINDPQTCIPEKNIAANDNNTYNGVAIEVNRPKVESCNHHRIYDYPCADCAVTSDFVPMNPIKIPELPILPIAYQTTNFINNKTLISSNMDSLNDEHEIELSTNNPLNSENNIEQTPQPEAVIAKIEEIHIIPEPNITTLENEKNNVDGTVFHGLNFKANENRQPIEIIPSVDIKPEIDIPNVLANLSNEDFDVQAQQMEEIARVSMEDPQKAVPYIVTEVFSELINIIKLNSAELTPPSERQIELRKQIIVNEIVKEQAKAQNQDISKIDLPYKLDEKDLKEASSLSSMEQAERNKEYALYTMAVLAKVYTDEVQKHTGNVVPLTDLPGVSTIVDSLKENSNSGVKIAAIDALRYIYKPEYKDELTAVLNLAAEDSNPYVSRTATIAVESIE